MNMLATIPNTHDLANLHDRVSRLVEGERTWTPAMDVIDLPEELLVMIEIPGVDPNSVETTLAGDVLEIRGEKPALKEMDAAKWFRAERGSGTFQRRLRLPYPIDAQRIEAQAKDGLLTVHLPRHAETLPRKIDIKVS